MLIQDHDRAGGYWGAVYVFTAIKGLQVVIDGPVGCENLPVTSVLHYTDALPPHELPIVVTGLGEEELGQHGTEGAMKRANAVLDPHLPSVVVTGSIAEMIGGGVTPEGTNIQRFLPRTIDEDQWQCADRALFWLWTEYGAKRGIVPKAKPRKEGARPKVNIIGPTYGMFNMPSDLAEIRRLIEGIGARGPHDLPARQPSRRGAAPGRCRGQCLPVPRIWPPALRGARPALSAGADRPAFDHRLPALARRTARASIPSPSSTREKHTHDQAALGSLALGDAGFLRHGELRHRRQRDLCPRHPPFPRRRDGPALHVRRLAPRRASRPTTTRCAPALKHKPPLILFGSYNERMYMAEAGGRGVYIPASFPGAVIRRHTGTPFMGYSGATYLVQEVCNALFDALFHILPLGTPDGRGRGDARRGCIANCPGRTRPRRCSTQLLEAQPVLVRISAAKRLRDAAEARARHAGEERVAATTISAKERSHERLRQLFRPVRSALRTDTGTPSKGGDTPMTMQFTARSIGSPSQARCWAADRRMCRRLVTITLPVFLVAAAVRRLPRAGAPRRPAPLALRRGARQRLRHHSLHLHGLTPGS